MEREKVLLLNPPGKYKYLRDYYCSHISKGHYYWAPYDLFVIAGQLKLGYEIIFLDAILENLSFEQTLEKIESYLPLKAIVFLTGGVSWKNDLKFLKLLSEKLKSKSNFLLIGNGDVCLDLKEKILIEYPFIDAIITNFVDNSLLYFLDERDEDFYYNIIYRSKEGFIKNTIRENSYYVGQRRFFSYPVPDYLKFPYKKYRLPHSINPIVAGTITTYGCPFKCSFCVGAKLPVLIRRLDNLYEELSYLQMLDIKELWIKDLTFGVPREHALAVCKMLKEHFNFKWICLSRVDVLDEKLLSEMKEAGCHTIQIGVETASEELLKKYNKNTKLDQIKKVFALCKKYKIRTLAHFILGLPGDTKEFVEKTINFAIELDPDIASFNIAAPRMGTDLREKAIEEGWIFSEDMEIDNSISFPSIETNLLPASELWKLRNKAIRKFYLRPYYIIKRITNLKSLYELKTLFLDGWYHLKTTLKKNTEDY